MNKAQAYGALISPAGEAFYDLSKTNGVSYYDSGDDTHPQPIGSFVSACSMYYTIFGEEACESFSDSDVKRLSALINSYVSNSGSGKQETYSKSLLNQINELAHKYARKIAPVAADKTGTLKYVSVAGEYEYVPSDD